MSSAQLRFLESSEIELRRDISGVVKLRLDKNEEHLISKICVFFPVTNFGEFIGLYDERGGEICIVKDYRMLSSTSRKVLEEELEKIRFIEIREIESIIEKEDGFLIWKVQTNKGVCEFEIMRERLFIRGSRVFIFDSKGNKYWIPDYEQMPRRSKKLFDKYF